MRLPSHRFCSGLLTIDHSTLLYADVEDAKRIKQAYDNGVKAHKGAVEVQLLSGRTVMVDAPVRSAPEEPESDR